MTNIYGRDDRQFTLYMRDGTRHVQKERSIADAIRVLGVAAIDVEWSDVGNTDTHYWCVKTKAWIRRHPS